MTFDLRHLAVAPVHCGFEFSDHMSLKIEIRPYRADNRIGQRWLVDDCEKSSEFDEFKPSLSFPERGRAWRLSQRFVDVGCIVAKAFANWAFRGADAKNRPMAIAPRIHNAAEHGCTRIHNINADSIATAVQRHEGNGFESRPINDHRYVLDDFGLRARQASGVLCNFSSSKGTGAGKSLQERAEITFQKEAAE